MATSDTVTAQYLGQPVEVEDPTNRDQCMDWVFLACDRMGIDRATIRHLYAAQAWTQPNDATRAAFDLIVNTPDYVPPANALAVFSINHIAWVLSGSTKQDLVTSDQNWGGRQYVQRVVHAGYEYVMGFLVPKGLGAPVSAPVNSGTYRAIRPAAVRSRASVSAPESGTMLLNPGDTFQYVNIVHGDLVAQNGVSTDLWAQSTKGNYVWTGNLVKA